MTGQYRNDEYTFFRTLSSLIFIPQTQTIRSHSPNFAYWWYPPQKKPLCFCYTLSHRSVRFMSTNKTRNKWLPISFVGFFLSLCRFVVITRLATNPILNAYRNSLPLVLSRSVLSFVLLSIVQIVFASIGTSHGNRWRSVWRTRIPPSLQILPSNSVHLTPRLIRTYLHFQTRTFWLISIVNWAIRRSVYGGWLFFCDRHRKSDVINTLQYFIVDCVCVCTFFAFSFDSTSKTSQIISPCNQSY